MWGRAAGGVRAGRKLHVEVGVALEVHRINQVCLERHRPSLSHFMLDAKSHLVGARVGEGVGVEDGLRAVVGVEGQTLRRRDGAGDLPDLVNRRIGQAGQAEVVQVDAGDQELLVHRVARRRAAR